MKDVGGSPGDKILDLTKEHNVGLHFFFFLSSISSSCVIVVDAKRIN